MTGTLHTTSNATIGGTLNAASISTTPGAILGTNLYVPGTTSIGGNTSIGGTARIGGGSPADGKVLTATDNAGNAIWIKPAIDDGALLAIPYPGVFAGNTSGVYQIPFRTSFSISPVNQTYTPFDDGSNFNNATNSFDPVQPGVYAIDVSVYFNTVIPVSGSADVTVHTMKLQLLQGNTVMEETPIVVHKNGQYTTTLGGFPTLAYANPFSQTLRLSVIHKMITGALPITFRLVYSEANGTSLPFNYEINNGGTHLSIYRLY